MAVIINSFYKETCEDWLTQGETIGEIPLSSAFMYHYKVYFKSFLFFFNIIFCEKSVKSPSVREVGLPYTLPPSSAWRLAMLQVGDPGDGMQWCPAQIALSCTHKKTSVFPVPAKLEILVWQVKQQGGVNENVTWKRYPRLLFSVFHCTG